MDGHVQLSAQCGQARSHVLAGGIPVEVKPSKHLRS